MKPTQESEKPREITFRTQGGCSRNIHITLEGDVVRGVEFENGCDGNGQGIARLVEGMKAADVIERLHGIRCDFKQTSCPDQLAKALEQALAEEK